MLNTSELLLLSTALGADLFSVAIPIGVKHICWRLVSGSCFCYISHCDYSGIVDAGL